jgi:hypothetical protein
LLLVSGYRENRLTSVCFFDRHGWREKRHMDVSGFSRER